MPAGYLRPLWLFSCLAAGVAAVIVLGLTDEQDFVQMSVAALVVTLSCVSLVALRWGADFSRAPLFWIVLFCFFHFGLVWTLGLLGEDRVAQVSSTALYWIHTPYLRPAVTVAAIGALVYSLVVAASAPRTTNRGLAVVQDPDQSRQRRTLSRAGLLLQVLGVAVLAYTIVRNGGLGLLSGGYLAFLESAQDSTTGYAIWAVGVGSSLTQVGTSNVRRLGLGVFVGFAVVLFPLGLRGSVLFPAAVLFATRSLIGRRVRGPVLVTAAVLALAGSAIVRSTRVGRQSSDSGVLDGVVSTITELGFSIRPTAEALRWANTGQEPTWFVSFVAVPLRLVESLTGWHGGPPTPDYRLFNVKVNDLVGAIGGSPVAEGYDAAGTVGVAVVLGVIGFVLSRVARGPFDTAVSLALFPVIVLPLTIAVRNSFAPVIPQILLGLAVVFLARLRARSAQAPTGARPKDVGRAEPGGMPGRPNASARPEARARTSKVRRAEHTRVV